jgi:hypothetical protein
MGFADDPLELTPNQFEAAVKRFFERDSIVLESYNSRLREKIDDDPEQYEIDIAIRFASKSPCLVFVECKNHKSKIKRQQVEALRDTVESTGAQKGIMVSVRGFQKNAIHYARQHGIVLLTIQNGELGYMSRRHGAVLGLVVVSRGEEFSFWRFSTNDGEIINISRVETAGDLEPASAGSVVIQVPLWTEGRKKPTQKQKKGGSDSPALSEAA